MIIGSASNPYMTCCFLCRNLFNGFPSKTAVNPKGLSTVAEVIGEGHVIPGVCFEVKCSKRPFGS